MQGKIEVWESAEETIAFERPTPVAGSPDDNDELNKS
jgi:hypothetical protein